MGLIRAFGDLPLGVRIAVAVVALALIVTLAIVLPPAIGLIIAIGVPAAVGTLVIYALVMRTLSKRREGPFLRRLTENASAAPGAVKDPAARARLDDLRRQFEEGIQTFKDHGKDLYSVPWYALVGEPGSGKTEAVRHSSIGFPPGLQDQLQGSGGTLNMSWWFSSNAVILDTAGRLMFEDVATARTSEWKEFLKLLRAVRPRCPINGMLLVIPADALIRDAAADLEAKASKIAEQLDNIQRSLGVRFPVFVIVTKADLINGFREFFDDLTDPAVQHQMLGWSNPAPLDTPFKPSEVEEHLRSVKERLLRRRLGLMVDPVHTEDPRARRLEQVDALYAFPDALEKIGPRLRKYLEMIFVAGEWSQRPLFLRGIYFTSSMRDGAALDADLAQALGVPVDDLPEGKMWEKDRSYFLKDLFLDKVFKEKGLVTRAASTARLKRGRQAAIVGAAAAVLLLAAGMTALGYSELRSSILESRAFWVSVRDWVVGGDPVNSPEIVFQDDTTGRYAYNGRERLLLRMPDGQIDETNPVGVLQRAGEMAAEQRRPPLVFGPIATLFGDPFAQRAAAVRGLVDAGVVSPAVRLAQDELAGIDEGRTWTAEEVAAFVEIASFDAAARAGTSSNAGGGAVGPLVEYLLSGEGAEANALTAYQADEGVIAQLSGSQPAIEPGGAALGTEEALAFVASGVDRVIEWAESATSSSAGGGVTARVAELVSAMESYRAAESATLDSPPPPANASLEQDEAARAAAAGRINSVTEAAGRLDAALSAAGDLPDMPAAELIARAQTEASDGPVATLDRLDTALALAAEAPEISGLRGRLAAARSEVLDAATRSLDELIRRRGELAWLIAGAPGGERPLFASRAALLGSLESALLLAEEDLTDTPVEDLVSQLGQREQATAELAASLALGGEGDTFAGAAAALQASASRAALTRRLLEELDFFESAPVAESVAARARSLAPVQRPIVARTGLRGGAFDPAFHPAATGEAIERFTAVADAARGRPVLSGAGLNQRLAAAETALVDHGLQYVAYWSSAVPAMAEFDAERGDWSGFRASISAVLADQVNQRLADLTATIESSLDRVPADWIDRTPGARETVDALAAEREQLVDVQYRLIWQETLDRWKLLGVETEEARRELLARTPGTFRQTLLPATSLGGSGAGKGPGTRFWGSLGWAGLEALASSVEREGKLARDELIGGAKAQPVCVDASAALTLDEVERLGAQSARLAALTSQGEPGAGRLLDGDESGLSPRAIALVRRIRGTEVLPSQAWRDWFDKIVTAFGVLETPDDLGSELVLIGLGRQPSGEAARRYAYVGASFRGQALTLDGRARVPAEDALPQTGVRLVVPAVAPLRIELASTASGPPEAVGAIPAPWGVLGVLESAGGPLSERDDPNLPPGLEGVWLREVPLSSPAGGALLDREGEPLRYWVGIRFRGDLPAPPAWPRVADWP